MPGGRKAEAADCHDLPVGVAYQLTAFFQLRRERFHQCQRKTQVVGQLPGRQRQAWIATEQALGLGRRKAGKLRRLKVGRAPVGILYLPLDLGDQRLLRRLRIFGERHRCRLGLLERASNFPPLVGGIVGEAEAQPCRGSAEAPRARATSTSQS